MPLTDLVRYFNAADQTSDNMLYLEGSRAAAWHGGLRLGSLFQPIVDLRDRHIVGHRATLQARNEAGDPVAPEDVYVDHASPAEIVHLDRLCRTLHALNFLAQHRYAGGYLQMAVHYRHLQAVPNQHGLVYEAILKRCGLAPADIVLEFDAAAPGVAPVLDRALDNYRQRGYRIALQHAQPAQWHALSPDLLLDTLSSPGAPTGQPAGQRVELSGIDDAPACEAARAAGIELGRGRHFGEPQAQCLPTHSRRTVA